MDNHGRKKMKKMCLRPICVPNLSLGIAGLEVYEGGPFNGEVKASVSVSVKSISLGSE